MLARYVDVAVPGSSPRWAKDAELWPSPYGISRAGMPGDVCIVARRDGPRQLMAQGGALGRIAARVALGCPGTSWDVLSLAWTALDVI